MGTLARQAEIGVWVQAPRGSASANVGKYHPENCDTVYAKSCNLVHFRPSVRPSVRLPLI